jgi:hypothetical protein
MMNHYDADIGWLNTAAMGLCHCGHFQRSHRPISRKCSLCDCLTFLLEKDVPALPDKA